MRHIAPTTAYFLIFCISIFIFQRVWNVCSKGRNERLAKPNVSQTSGFDPAYQRIPGSLTSIPLRAILRDSMLGATSNAVARSIFFI